MRPRLPEARALLFLLGVLALACGGPAPAVPQGEALPVDAAPEAERRAVTLFYAEESSGLLAPCEARLPLTGEALSDAKLLLDRYLQGPPCEGQANPFPEGTALRAVFLLQDGSAVVDVSGRAATGGGASTETLRVYGLVDTLVANLPGVRSVRILVDGREVESLLGHLDLLRPIPPEMAVVTPEGRVALQVPAP